MLVNYSEDVYEKVLLINIIGTLEAVNSEKLSIRETEQFIFSPHMIAKLREAQCNGQIIDILERGCKLEDVVSLLPERLTDSVNNLKEMALEVLENYQEDNKRFWIRE